MNLGILLIACSSAICTVTFLLLGRYGTGLATLGTVSAGVLCGVMLSSVPFWRAFWTLFFFVRGYRPVSREADFILSELLSPFSQGIRRVRKWDYRVCVFVSLHFITLEELPWYQIVAVSWSAVPTFTSLSYRSTRRFLTKPRLGEDLKLLYFEKVLCAEGKSDG